MSDGLLGIPGLTFGGVGNWAIFAAVVVAIVRIIPQMTALRDAADRSLRKELMERIDQLEKIIAEERAECSRRIEALELIAFGKGAVSTLSAAERPSE